MRLGLFLGFVLLLLGIERYFLYRLLQYVRNKGHDLRTILIAGSTARAKQLIQSMKRHPGAGYRIIGCLDDDPEKAGRDLVQGVKVIGGLKDLPEILQHNSVDELIFTQPDKDFQGAEAAIALAEEQGITVRFILDEEAAYTSDG